MSVVSFEGFTPPPRYDNLPYTSVRIEEASASTGPWTLIDTFPLSPLDPDPAEPLERDFTTENATLDSGWYRLQFLDANADPSNYSDPIQNVSTVAYDVRPSVRELAKLMRARARDKYGNATDTFTDDTSPTHDEAYDIITDAVDMVLIKLGGEIPSKFFRQVRRTILLKAATLVELTYAREGADSESAYDRYNNQYMELMGGPQTTGTLVDALEGDQVTGDSSGNYIVSVPMIGSTGRRSLSRAFVDYDFDDLIG